MQHAIKNYERLLPELQGALSPGQLRAHFAIYGGYVRQLNEIEAELATVDRRSAGYPHGAYSELRRSEPEAYNAVALHELYFENLGRAGGTIPPAFRRAVLAAFGTWEAWLADVRACMASGPGWTLVTWDARAQTLRNNLLRSTHDAGLLVGQHILVALDHWEHAYFTDFGARKSDYCDAMLSHIDWRTVAQRVAETDIERMPVLDVR